MPWEKQFDKQEVLRKATSAFWANGYEATSLCDLLNAMGIQKGSFYATFSSKHELLMDCLESYVESRSSCFEALLSDPSPKAAFKKHFELLAESSSGPNQAEGCFLVNATLELAPRDEKVRALSQKTLDKYASIYRELIEKGQGKGEISSSVNAESASRALVSLAMGMQMLGRASMPKHTIESIRDEAIKLIS